MEIICARATCVRGGTRCRRQGRRGNSPLSPRHGGSPLRTQPRPVAKVHGCPLFARQRTIKTLVGAGFKPALPRRTPLARYSLILGAGWRVGGLETRPLREPQIRAQPTTRPPSLLPENP